MSRIDEMIERAKLRSPTKRASSPVPDFDGYDRILVGFSGGKDSTAAYLALLEAGADPNRIELWHHRIDPPGKPFMDWPCTPAWCETFAQAYHVPLYFSWREGGFEGAILRENAPPAAISMELPSGRVLTTGGDSNKLNTMLKFPLPIGDLGRRWCSSTLKIEVGARVFTRDPRFQTGRFLMVTGERAQESDKRANYAVLEPDRANSQRRQVDRYRIVHEWKESDVWDILKRHGAVPHPAYRLGFGRTSCLCCIFGEENEWATIRAHAPRIFKKVLSYERRFGVTIKMNRRDIEAWADKGQDLMPQGFDDLFEKALSEKDWTEPVRVNPSEWKLPKGAYTKGAGPN